MRQRIIYCNGKIWSMGILTPGFDVKKLPASEGPKDSPTYEFTYYEIHKDVNGRKFTVVDHTEKFSRKTLEQRKANMENLIHDPDAALLSPDWRDSEIQSLAYYNVLLQQIDELEAQNKVTSTSTS